MMEPINFFYEQGVLYMKVSRIQCVQCTSVSSGGPIHKGFRGADPLKVHIHRTIFFYINYNMANNFNTLKLKNVSHITICF